MAETKTEEEWRAAVKSITEADDDKELDDVPKSTKTDVVVGSEEEQLLTEAVVATITRQKPEICKNDPDVANLAVAFLRFREYGVVDAVARLGRFLEFRARFEVQRQVTLNPTLKAMLLDGTRVLLPGTDKEGRALMLMTMRHNRPYEPKLLMQVTNWVIMKTLARGPLVQKKGVTSILDLEGSSFKNIDLSQMKEIRPSTMKCFPIRTGQCFVINTSAIADVIIPLIKVFSDKMGSRITIVKDVSEIHQYIDKSQLPPSLGGTLNFDFKKWVDENNV